jgi:hypothetical protein
MVLRLVVAVLHYMFRPTWPSSRAWCFTFVFLKEFASLLLLPLLHVVILCSFSFVFCVFVSFLILVCVLLSRLSFLSVAFVQQNLLAFPPITYTHFSFPHSIYMPRPRHPLRLDYSNYWLSEFRRKIETRRHIPSPPSPPNSKCQHRKGFERITTTKLQIPCPRVSDSSRNSAMIR